MCFILPPFQPGSHPMNEEVCPRPQGCHKNLLSIFAIDIIEVLCPYCRVETQKTMS